MSEGVTLLELANNAQRLFAQQEPREKRRLLNFLLSNCTWNDGVLTAKFRQPFDMLAETITAVRSETASESGFGGGIDNWLPEQEPNRLFQAPDKASFFAAYAIEFVGLSSGLMLPARARGCRQMPPYAV